MLDMWPMNYMSPEWLNVIFVAHLDEHNVRLKADVWALGVTLYDMIYGHLPFNSSPAPSALGSAILNEQMVIPFPNSTRLAKHMHVCSRCLVRGYVKRASLDELLFPFRAL